MVISWIVILVLLGIGLVYMKLEHHGRLLKAGILVFFLLLILFSMSSIFKTRDTDSSSPKEVMNTIYLYFGWLGNTVNQLWDVGSDTVVAVGNVVKINDSEIELEKYDWKGKIKLPFKK